MSYSYDSHGNRATMTYPNGKTVSYSYDEMNRLVSVKGVDGKTTRYSYDALGRRIATEGAKETSSYTYDEVGNLVSQTTTGAYDLALSYAYDLSGRMTSESRTENGATLTSSYVYDALGQLTGFTRSDGLSESYAYDPVGNMKAKTQNGVSTAMKYNAANQLVQSVTGNDTTKYAYDANGNLVRSENAGGARSYAYNALGLLSQFTGEDGYVEYYSYNANGLLSSITTSEDLTTALTWDILYGDGVVIGATQNGKTTSYTYGLERISAIAGNTRTEYVHDGRGSVAAEVSYNTAWYTFGGGLARKNVTSKSYTPFGEQIGEVTGGFGYNGEYYNAATGMIYLRARFYEPELNRFSQKDTLRGSIADPVGLNRYLYCQSDPVNFADYNGLQMVSLKDGFGGGKTKTTTITNDITKKNQPPTYKEFSSQSGYDPLRPSSMWSSTGSKSDPSTQSQQGKTSQSTGITQTSPSVQSVTGNKGYNCGSVATTVGTTSSFLYGLINSINKSAWIDEAARLIGEAADWMKNGSINAPVVQNLEQAAKYNSLARRAFSLSNVASVAGAAIDLFYQLATNESKTEAVVKTSAHLLIGYGIAAVIGAAVFSVSAPVAGLLILGGAVASVYLSNKADYYIDKTEERTGVFSTIDNAICNFFSRWG